MTKTTELRPASWWRRLCQVTDRLFICGDLPHDPDGFRRMLQEWVDAGITHIVDVRGEWSDESRVADAHPHISYAWLPTHDNGGGQDADWFEQGVETICDALADPDTRVVIHCHMGVNRAPSMAFAALLELGFEVGDGLATIRAARPIAAILYAESAIDWFAERSGWTASQTGEARMRVRAWHAENPSDVWWVISRIRLAEAEAA